MLDPEAEDGEGGTGLPGRGAGDKQFGRSIDQEEERFQRFIKELNRHFDVTRLPHSIGQATLDVFEPTNKTAPYWTANHKQALAPIVPLLRRPDYRVTIVVWAPMAKDSAMQRAVEKAAALAGELADVAQLDPRARARLAAVAQTWEYTDYQRPVLSIVIVRTRVLQDRP